jgi:Fe-S cluster assembly scaffold protein SufB
MKNDKLISALYESIGKACVTEPGVAHVKIHANKVLGLHLVSGLTVDADELSDGIRATLTVKENHEIEQPVRICFGLLEKNGTQKIGMKIRLESQSRVAILASCTFPNAVDVL